MQQQPQSVTLSAIIREMDADELREFIKSRQGTIVDTLYAIRQLKLLTNTPKKPITGKKEGLCN